MSAKTNKLYGFSIYFLPRDGHGQLIKNAPQAVREFTVTEDKGDTLVLNDRWAIPKKGMTLDLGEFKVPLHGSIERVRDRMQKVIGL